MLWYCQYSFHPTVSIGLSHHSILEQAYLGGGFSKNPERIRAWYNVVGSGRGEGIILVDCNEEELDDMLGPYLDVVAWDARPIVEWTYESRIKTIRRHYQHRPEYGPEPGGPEPGGPEPGGPEPGPRIA